MFRNLALATAFAVAGTALQSVALPAGAHATCGWFAIADCTRNGGLNRKAARLGGFASDTGFVRGFRPGWICIMQGPTSKAQARRISQRWKRSTPSAYIKRGCTQGDVW